MAKAVCATRDSCAQRPGFRSSLLDQGSFTLFFFSARVPSGCPCLAGMQQLVGGISLLALMVDPQFLCFV